MGIWSHYIDSSDVQRGDHVYALRGVGTYQHHGIIISGADANDLKPKPEIIKTFMVIEQNLDGLRVVTLEKFTYEDSEFIKGNRSLRRAQYDENPFAYGIKRRGSCYLQKALPAELIILNAISIYNDADQKEKWSSYSLISRNCEHFAFKCCVEINMASEQVLGMHDLLSNMLSSVSKTIASALWGHTKSFLTNVIYIGEKAVPSSITNLTITSLDELVKASLNGNAITAGIALLVEVVILTIRWVIYLCVRKNNEKREKYFANGWAINTEKFVKCLIQAGIANGVSFGMSIAGGAVGVFIPLPGATVGFSILFGFIGYVIARWGAGALIETLQQMINEKNE
ncbi:unnamed protein product [Adineta steineri]|uniref:LRAT domain-containing protein n=1 Tax=Adineta steineri TaxID=433720 RepID=A0A814LBB6_9BILA|nr:unnamed protein product [Adineta steineri]CAF3974304.1 unnamed protein product [Adineta steineri]